MPSGGWGVDAVSATGCGSPNDKQIERVRDLVRQSRPQSTLRSPSTSARGDVRASAQPQGFPVGCSVLSTYRPGRQWAGRGPGETRGRAAEGQPGPRPGRCDYTRAVCVCPLAGSRPLWSMSWSAGVGAVIERRADRSNRAGDARTQRDSLGGAMNEALANARLRRPPTLAVRIRTAVRWTRGCSGAALLALHPNEPAVDDERSRAIASRYM